MVSAIHQIAKFLRNLADDALIVLVTAAGVILKSYWPTIREAMVEHTTWARLDKPNWLTVGLALMIAVVVVAIDANSGDEAGRKAKVKPRLGKHLMIGLGALSLIEAAVGGGA